MHVQSDRHRTVPGGTDSQALNAQADSELDQDNKYVKRTGSVKRSLQRVMPAIFQPSLPVTTRYWCSQHVHIKQACFLCIADIVAPAINVQKAGHYVYWSLDNELCPLDSCASHLCLLAACAGTSEANTGDTSSEAVLFKCPAGM